MAKNITTDLLGSRVKVKAGYVFQNMEGKVRGVFVGSDGEVMLLIEAIATDTRTDATEEGDLITTYARAVTLIANL